MNAGRNAEHDLAVVVKDGVVGKFDDPFVILRGHIHTDLELLVAQLYGCRQILDAVEA